MAAAAASVQQDQLAQQAHHAQQLQPEVVNASQASTVLVSSSQEALATQQYQASALPSPIGAPAPASPLQGGSAAGPPAGGGMGPPRTSPVRAGPGPSSPVGDEEYETGENSGGRVYGPRKLRKKIDMSEVNSRLSRLEEAVAWVQGEVIGTQVRSNRRTARVTDIIGDAKQAEMQLAAAARRLGTPPTSLEVQYFGQGCNASIEFSTQSEKDRFVEAARNGQIRVGGHPVRPVRSTPGYRLVADTPLKAAIAALGASPDQVAVWWPERLLIETASRRPLIRTQWRDNASCVIYTHPVLKDEFERRMKEEWQSLKDRDDTQGMDTSATHNPPQRRRYNQAALVSLTFEKMDQVMIDSLTELANGWTFKGKGKGFSSKGNNNKGKGKGKFKGDIDVGTNEFDYMYPDQPWFEHDLEGTARDRQFEEADDLRESLQSSPWTEVRGRRGRARGAAPGTADPGRAPFASSASPRAPQDPLSRGPGGRGRGRGAAAASLSFGFGWGAPFRGNGGAAGSGGLGGPGRQRRPAFGAVGAPWW